MEAFGVVMVNRVIPLIGHLGGIDEIGIFVVPALLAIFALRWAERRARRREAVEDEDAAGPQETDHGAGRAGSGR
jgi:hypothetical protein